MTQPAPFPPNEEARLAALASCRILDTQQDQIYDDFTQLASYIAQTPMALISLIDRDRQWFKSRIGIAETQTPREVSFCAHAINTPSQNLIVPDATKDDRFKTNPFVTENPNIRFYFGAPIVTSQNYALGTLCVIDSKPRHMTAQQEAALSALARQLATFLDIRKAVFEMKHTLQQEHRAHNNDRQALDRVEELTRDLYSLILKKEDIKAK